MGQGLTALALFPMREWKALNVGSTCIYDDTVLREHIRHALSLGLPVCDLHPPHDGVAVLVASGPSVAGQLESIRRQRARGRPIIAIKDAHDWLMEQDVVPDYAVAIDPRVGRWNCFRRKHHAIKYLLASQCHADMFEHLRGHQIWLWHLFISEPKTVLPPEAWMIGGGSTTGLRAINLFYTMGFRRFELYGYDSCLQDGVLRVNGDTPKEAQPIPVKVGTRTFWCNPAMAHQAQTFQPLFAVMPDMLIQSYGDGLITAILREREKGTHGRPKMRPDAMVQT